MAVPSPPASPLGDVKYSVPNKHFRAKYIDNQIKSAFFFWDSLVKGTCTALEFRVSLEKKQTDEKVSIVCNRPCHGFRRLP